VHPTPFAIRRRDQARQINLPVFAIGAGVIHAIGLAVLLPLLITLPGPGSDIDPHAVAIDVDIVPASRPSPNTKSH
jgi:hypothetical protein